MLCKNYASSKGCQAGDKCQFAHGEWDLRSIKDPIRPRETQKTYYQMPSSGQPQMYPPNVSNYKTVKCYYFEKNKTCKHGKACPFAHSDAELRSKDEISMLNRIASQMNSQLISNSNTTTNANTIINANTNTTANTYQMTPEEYQRKLQEQYAYYYYNANPQLLYAQQYAMTNDVSSSSDTNFGNGKDNKASTNTNANPNPGTNANTNPGTNANTNPGTNANTNPGTNANTNNVNTNQTTTQQQQEADSTRFQLYEYEGKYYYYDTLTGYSYPYTAPAQDVPQTNTK